MLSETLPAESVFVVDHSEILALVTEIERWVFVSHVDRPLLLIALLGGPGRVF